MEIAITVDPEKSTPHEFARVVVSTRGGAPIELDVDYSTLKTWEGASPEALDFLYFSAVAYSIDKLVSRRTAADGWTRDLDVSLPIARHELWSSLAGEIADCLGFLTGDRWTFSFAGLDCPLARPSTVPLRGDPFGVRRRPVGAVCLFSGGLDSLVGAIDWLETNPEQTLVLAGHHDPRVPGPLGDQERLLEELRPSYPNRTRPLRARIAQRPSGREITLRSRSILFIALGLYAASSVGDAPLLIPENGNIALNVPLTPSRRGSCSTRTAHPHYLDMLHHITTRLGISARIENPMRFKTKGEVVAQCRNRPLLERAAELSASCAKRGHTSTWRNRSARGCGRCMPCIYRRASLHTIGLDKETYGVDICAGDVDLDSAASDVPNDFRACLSFLSKALDRRKVASLLMASGPLPIADLPAYSALVLRAMDEIRRLLKDKGIEPVRRRAGL
jgi:hypothetical protein